MKYLRAFFFLLLFTGAALANIPPGHLQEKDIRMKSLQVWITYVAYSNKERCSEGKVKIRIVGEISNVSDLHLSIVKAISEIPELKAECPDPLIIITDVNNVSNTSI